MEVNIDRIVLELEKHEISALLRVLKYTLDPYPPGHVIQADARDLLQALKDGGVLIDFEVPEFILKKVY
jgi:hypothetical protein